MDNTPIYVEPKMGTQKKNGYNYNFSINPQENRPNSFCFKPEVPALWREIEDSTKSME